METTEPQRPHTVRDALRTAQVALGVRVQFVDRHWLTAWWAAGINDGVKRDRHLPTGQLVAVGIRDDVGALVLLVNRDLPHQSPARAQVAHAITGCAVALCLLEDTPACQHVQVAALCAHDGELVTIEQAPRPGLIPQAQNTRLRPPGD